LKGWCRIQGDERENNKEKKASIEVQPLLYHACTRENCSLYWFAFANFFVDMFVEMNLIT
jgi:hypothetical protein